MSDHETCHLVFSDQESEVDTELDVMEQVSTPKYGSTLCVESNGSDYHNVEALRVKFFRE